MIIKEDLVRIKEDRGPNDLENQIDMLTKQKEYMQKKCREAGAAILQLENQVQTLKKDLDRISEERDNFVTMLGDGKVEGL
jgi:chromosome segregation ATPase